MAAQTAPQIPATPADQSPVSAGSDTTAAAVAVAATGAPAAAVADGSVGAAAAMVPEIVAGIAIQTGGPEGDLDRMVAAAAGSHVAADSLHVDAHHPLDVVASRLML